MDDAKLKEFGLLRAIVSSFYSKKLYRDVGQNWRGIGLGYLFLLTALVLIPMSAISIYHFHTSMQPDGQRLIAQLPQQIRINAGDLTMSEQSPFVLVNINSGKPTIVFDTSDKPKSINDSQATVLITKDNVQVRTSKHQVRVISFPEEMNIKVDHQRLAAWLDNLILMLTLFTYPLMLVGLFVLRFFQILLYSILGLILNDFIKAPLNYAGLLRVCTIALTPAIIISMLEMLIQGRVPYIGFLCFFLTVFYIIFGLRANNVAE